MNKTESKRRRRWKEASKSRTKNALFSIGSIKKLAQKSNYDYTQDEVWDLIYELLEAITELVFAFSKGETAAEKYKKLIEFDVFQLKSLAVTDPELYEHIIKNHSASNIRGLLEKNSEVPSEFLKKKAEKDFNNLTTVYEQLRESESIIADEIEELSKAMGKITLIKK